ncbi:MAG: GGDEF domain-containing protein [Clostridia bacterium]|nr:GGDEF domain-containing protein [Clostridia bacterium]
MTYLLEFLHQKAPKSGKSMPAYYRKSVRVCEAILVAFMLASVILLALTNGKLEWLPVAICAGVIACYPNTDKMSANSNLLCISLAIVFWLTWFVYNFGWSAGSPNILIPLLSLTFFNIYISPRGKIAYCFGLIAFRILLFIFSLRHTAPNALSPSTSLIFQILNSLIPLIILANNYILFSSSVQASERQLTINNQALHKEAGTDPLTGLPNRRALLDVIDNYRRDNPSSQFSIAIADIDFFKRVNDTYGHNCGDYTLKTLARLFMDKAESKYTVCRWGGEEFCFFLREQNLDEAGILMHELHGAVK